MSIADVALIVIIVAGIALVIYATRKYRKKKREDDFVFIPPSERPPPRIDRDDVGQWIDERQREGKTIEEIIAEIEATPAERFNPPELKQQTIDELSARK